MGKRLIGRLSALVAVACLAVPFVSCTAPGGGGGEAATVPTGGTFRCSCGITKKVGPGAPAPKCCGKPMKQVAQK